MESSNATVILDQMQPASVQLLSLISFSFACLFIVGVATNFIVLVLLVGFIRVRSSTDVYVLNLATADLLLLAWIPFVIARILIGEWLWGAALCKLYFASTTINQLASVAFLLSLAVDRYMAVCLPTVSQRHRTAKTAILASLASWLVCALMATPVYIYATTVSVVAAEQEASNPPNPNQSHKQQKEHVQCTILWPEPEWHSIFSQRSFTIYSAVISYALPLTIIWLLYGLVIRRVRRQQTLGRALRGANQNRVFRLREGPQQAIARTGRPVVFRKATRMAIAAVLCYTLCWMPYWILQIAIDVLDEETLLGLAGPVFSLVSFGIYCVQYANSVFNPVLYALGSRSFRKASRRLLRKSPAKTSNLVNREEARGADTVAGQVAICSLAKEVPGAEPEKSLRHDPTADSLASLTPCSSSSDLKTGNTSTCDSRESLLKPGKGRGVKEKLANAVMIKRAAFVSAVHG